MSNVNQKCFKFNVLAKPEFSQEYVRYVYAENKEQALKKLEFNFLDYEIEQAILVDVRTKKEELPTVFMKMGNHTNST